jgi:hypothetical protein
MCKRFERMMKCLELTASTNDAEALAAIRAANKIREELCLKWSDFADPKPGEMDWASIVARQWSDPEDEEQRRERERHERERYDAAQREIYRTLERKNEDAKRRSEEADRRRREEYRTRFPELQEDEGYS